VGFLFFFSFGYGLSDAYDQPASWFVVLDRLLLLLEAPVVIVLRLLYHPTARFDPSRLFAVDILDFSHSLVVGGLWIVWSVGFGYIAAYAIRRLKICWFGKLGDVRDAAVS